MGKLEQNIEATKKKIPSMDIPELIKTLFSGYHPECLGLALNKIMDDEAKYPKIAELYYKLQDELGKLAGIKKNFGIHKPKVCDYVAIVTDKNNNKPYAVPLDGENIDDARRIFKSGYGSLGAKLIDIYRYVDFDNGYGLNKDGKVNYNFSDKPVILSKKDAELIIKLNDEAQKLINLDSDEANHKLMKLTEQLDDLCDKLKLTDNYKYNIYNLVKVAKKVLKKNFSEITTEAQARALGEDLAKQKFGDQFNQKIFDGVFATALEECGENWQNVADYLKKVYGDQEMTNFSERVTKIKMHFGDISESAKEYAFTLAQEVFGDKADKTISDGVAENALKEGGDDEGKVMGIIKNSYCSH